MKIYIGTSGWVYGHWEGIFYPQGLKGKEKLKYFSQYFKTTEINYSFYHLPRPQTYQNWYFETPKDFLFSVKASRLITHIKRLKGVEEIWKNFLENALSLLKKLGPILFQFPPSFKTDKENLKRLKNFLKIISKDKRKHKNLSFAFEFRHESWCDEEIYQLLRKYGVAWVIADSPYWPKAEKVTSNFVYVRMHGSKKLFASKYTKEELKNLAEKIKKWKKEKLKVFVYFNNDAYGFAIENARELLEMIT